MTLHPDVIAALQGATRATVYGASAVVVGAAVFDTIVLRRAAGLSPAERSAARARARAIGYLAAAALVAGIRGSGAVDGSDASARSTANQPASRIRRFTHEWGQGLVFARSRRGLRAVFVFTLIAMVGEGVMGTLFAPFVRDVLDGTGRDYGFIAAVQAIGGIAGGFVAASVGQRFSPALMFGCGAVLFGLAYLAWRAAGGEVSRLKGPAPDVERTAAPGRLGLGGDPSRI